MITVSICMIVKNEEDKIARCLDCIKDFGDEIIIVDTGSTDSTKEIAAKYTDKVYDFAWVDDFAAARNYSFSLATMDYIYSADADEIVDEMNRKKMMQLKEVLLPEIEIVQMNYTNQLEFGSTYNYDSEPRPKLFKRLRTFEWQDPIHETIRTFPVIYDSDIDIIHKPHEPHHKRDFAVFKKIIKEAGANGAKGQGGVYDNDGNDILRLTAGLTRNARTMYVKELLQKGEDSDFLDALGFFKGMADAGILELRELNEAVCVIAKCALIKNDAAMLMKYVLKNLCDTPCSEICVIIGEYYYRQGDFNESYVWFYNGAYETEPLLVVKYKQEYAIRGLIRCCERLGDFEQAKKLEMNIGR